MATKAGPNIITDGLVLNIDPANVKSYPAKDDPYRDQVSLLLDGTSFTDKSRNNFTVTTYGNAQLVSDATFGTVASFDGSGDYLSVASNAAFPSGSSTEFTIECWVNLANLNAYRTIIRHAGGLDIGVQPDGRVTCDRTQVAGIASAPAGSVTANAWYHIAVTRSTSNLYSIYVNGILRGTGTNTFSVSPETTLFYSSYSGSHYFNGLIGPLRITKGFARYTANFTPPSRISSPARISDIKNNSIGTLTNGPVFSNVQNGVMSFDGAGDYLDFPSNESFNFSNNNFYIESWIYLNQYPVNNNGYYISTIICKDQISNRSWDFFITGTSSANTTLLFTGFINNSSVQQANISYGFNLNTWYHVACSRVGNYIYLYVNGICINSGGTSFTATIQNTSSVVRIGAQVYTTYYYYFNGNIANLKVYNNRGLSADEVQKNYTATRKRFVETPKTIPGLQLWLDGADLSTMRQNSNGTTAVALNSDPVGYWGDKSGNGRHATQGTLASRPYFLVNNKNELPSISCSPSQFLTQATGTVGINGSNGRTVFTVQKDYNPSTTYPTIIYWGSASIGRYYAHAVTNGVIQVDIYGSAATINIFTASYSITTSTLNSSNQSMIRRNKSNWSTNISSVNTTDTAYVIGKSITNHYFTNPICEVLVYNRNLADYEIIEIENYLNQKWAIF